MSKRFKEIMPSLIAVLIALLVGGIIMILKGVKPIFAYADMAKSAFYQTSPRSPFMSGLARTLLTATPLIFSALAAMVAFKAGLFNIGAQGQMIAGGLAATFWAVTFRNYVIGNLLIVLIVAMIAGFLWAGLAGYLKSKFGVNEVISTIMLNYIIIEFQNFVLNGPLKDAKAGNTQSEKIFERLNLGFVIVVILVIAIYLFFKYFRTGYDIKAVGNSETVAENAGISPKKMMFLAMGLAGICAGLGGAERVLGGSAQYVYTESIMGDAGFTGLAVALLGKNNPFGILIAGIFYAALDVGGSTLHLRYQVDKEIVSIIQALIIIFVASENLFKIFVSKRKGK